MVRTGAGRVFGAIAAGWLAAAVLGGCPETSSGEPSCEPGEVRVSANACGVCETGSREQACDDRRRWVDRSCRDPFDRDDDTYANEACTGLVGGCCTARIDCNDEDDAVHPDPLVCTYGSSESCTTTCGTPGRRLCTNACVWSDCAVDHDGCNGVDDDCDGDTDEDAACVPGVEVACTAVCGSRGSGDCTTDCLPPIGLDCNPPDERCNRTDDDCDGDTDEDFPCIAGSRVDCTTACGSTGRGNCSAACVLPAVDACTPPGERCDNGTDDDCDGETDELEPGQCVAGTTVGCTTSCGSEGSGICTTGCLPPTGAACLPPVEACNGADDDCDGGTDEDFPCRAGELVECTTTCDTAGLGLCAADCTLPAAASCTPPDEACGNGVDDDCDGGTDEDCPPPGEDCSAPIVLEPGTTEVPIDLCGYADDVEGTCGTGAGDDAVYSFTLATEGTVAFSTCNEVTAADTVLFLRATCDDPSSALFCDDDDPACTFFVGASSLSAHLTPGTYYLFVEVRGSICAPIRLDVVLP